MTQAAEAITTLQFYPKRSALRRYFALWYFTILLIVWNILGHLFLGFEQSHIQPLVGLATAIGLQEAEYLPEGKARRPNGSR